MVSQWDIYDWFRDRSPKGRREPLGTAKSGRDGIWTFGLSIRGTGGTLVRPSEGNRKASLASVLGNSIYMLTPLFSSLLSLHPMAKVILPSAAPYT